jgi:non-heme chloroperoxidase
MSPRLSAATLGALGRPILVVCGALDETAGAPEPLAQTFPDGKAVVIPNRDHMSAVGDRHTRQAVIDFFRN